MGKQKTDINWQEIDHLMVAGCPVREIAGYVGCSEKTIYDRCYTDNGETYSTYSQKRRAKGQSFLRAHQYAKALGKTEKGDNTLLIWLGKQRLDQRDKPKEEDIRDDLRATINEAIKTLDRLPRAEETGGPEVETEPPILD